MLPSILHLLAWCSLPVSFVVSLPSTVSGPLSLDEGILRTEHLNWPPLPYSSTYTPQGRGFSAVKLTFRVLGPMMSSSTRNGTGIIAAMRTAIESQSSPEQLRKDIFVEQGDLRARFSLPKGKSTLNTWYFLSALEALTRQYQTFGPRELKADVYDTGKIPMLLGTIVIADGKGGRLVKARHGKPRRKITPRRRRRSAKK